MSVPDPKRPHRPDEKPRRTKVTDKRHIRADDPREGSAAAGSPEGAVPQGPGVARGADEGGPSGAVHDELAAARAEAAEYREHLQRLQAEFENYRKRVIREQTRAVEFATEPLVSRLLEVVDEFELALVAAEQRPDFDKFLRGVEIVYAKLLDLLRAEGLERIDAQGQLFDPTQHEALFQAEGGDGEAYVTDVLRPGYRLKGRVIRPAGVKVARR
jgi:molecular chaperone GrpE